MRKQRRKVLQKAKQCWYLIFLLTQLVTQDERIMYMFLFSNGAESILHNNGDITKTNQS